MIDALDSVSVKKQFVEECCYPPQAHTVPTYDVVQIVASAVVVA